MNNERLNELIYYSGGIASSFIAITIIILQGDIINNPYVTGTISFISVLVFLILFWIKTSNNIEEK